MRKNKEKILQAIKARIEKQKLKKMKAKQSGDKKKRKKKIKKKWLSNYYQEDIWFRRAVFIEHTVLFPFFRFD